MASGGRSKQPESEKCARGRSSLNCANALFAPKHGIMVQLIAFIISIELLLVKQR